MAFNPVAQAKPVVPRELAGMLARPEDQVIGFRDHSSAESAMPFRRQPIPLPLQVILRRTYPRSKLLLLVGKIAPLGLRQTLRVAQLAAIVRRLIPPSRSPSVDGEPIVNVTGPGTMTRVALAEVLD